MIAVEVTDKIAIKTPYIYKDVLKAIPGASWNKSKKHWEYPKTARVIHDIMSNPELRAACDRPEIIHEFVQTVERFERAEKFKYCPAVELPPLATTRMKPWNHQLRGTHAIINQDATMLAYDMGTGKTKTTIDALNNWPFRLALIIAPKSVVPNWKKEFEKHGYWPFIIVTLGEGPLKKRGDLMERMIKFHQPTVPPLVFVVNYDGVYQGKVGEVVEKTDWDIVVCDEIHKIKSHSGITSKFFGRKVNAKKRVGLTGTPMPHSPLDVYGQYRFLDPSIYGTSFTMFRARYAQMGGYGGKQILGYQNIPELQDKFNSIALKVHKSDVLDLPPYTDELRDIELEPSATKLYKTLEKEFIADVGSGKLVANNALSRMLRLQQITSGFLPDPDEHTDETHTVSTAKYRELLDIFESIDSSEPIVVFCRFRNDLSVTAQAACQSGRTCMELSGTINELDRWQNSAKPGDVLAVQIQAGGVGIDLTRACYCVYYSTGWSLGEYEQSRARLHRPGQNKSVTFLHLIAQGTVDAKVYRSLMSKKKIVESVLEMYKKKEGD